MVKAEMIESTEKYYYLLRDLVETLRKEKDIDE